MRIVEGKKPGTFDLEGLTQWEMFMLYCVTAEGAVNLRNSSFQFRDPKRIRHFLDKLERAGSTWVLDQPKHAPVRKEIFAEGRVVCTEVAGAQPPLFLI